MPPLSELFQPRVQAVQPRLQGGTPALVNAGGDFQKMTRPVAPGQGAFEFTFPKDIIQPFDQAFRLIQRLPAPSILPFQLLPQAVAAGCEFLFQCLGQAW